MKIRFIGFATASLLLTSCSIQRAQDAERARTSMVGLGREQVLVCMGAPDSRAAAGNTEVWTYHTGNGETISGGQVSHWGFYSGESVTRSCKVDVVLAAGQVSRIQYSGLTGGLITQGEQCAYAIENCLAETPQPVRYIPPPPAGAPTGAASPPQSNCTHEQEVQARIAKQNGYTGGPKCD